MLADRLLESDSDEAESIEQFFALLGESGSIKQYAMLNEALYGLPADASESECAQLAEQFVSLMVPLLQRGCVRYGWELSQEDIEAMATPPAPMEGGCDARFAQGAQTVLPPAERTGLRVLNRAIKAVKTTAMLFVPTTFSICMTVKRSIGPSTG